MKIVNSGNPEQEQEPVYWLLRIAGTDYKSAPAGEGLVFRAEDYVYSSVGDYAGEKGLLNVIVIY